MFTFQEMQQFADWYHNWLTNIERSELGMQGAFDVWFENYWSKQIEESWFWKKKVYK